MINTLCTIALTGSATIAAHAQDASVAVDTVRATAYLNGGIGQSEENAMRSVAKDFPLRMVFSAGRHNAFVADVGLLVTDMNGVPACS